MGFKGCCTAGLLKPGLEAGLRACSTRGELGWGEGVKEKPQVKELSNNKIINYVNSSKLKLQTTVKWAN